MSTFNFFPNQKDIHSVIEMYDNGLLIVDESYQRRSVWNERDNIRLIETILLNYVVPELFFWPSDIDPDSGKTTIHIVDGQQRINAIDDFVAGEYKLEVKHLKNETIKQKFGNKFFHEFEPEDRKNFWSYKLTIIDIDKNASKQDVVEMFNRLNLTDYSLNYQEKRNSLSGDFAKLAKAIASESIWTDFKLFRPNEIKRMKDVEFSASLILLFKEGIIDQTDQTALNRAYDAYKTDYKNYDGDKQSILMAISTIKPFLENSSVLRFLKKTSQLYTMFSIIFFMLREKIEYKESQRTNMTRFVNLYAEFDNDIDLSSELSAEEKVLYDLLKKYKLASSEGLHKHVNRMIRFNVLRKFVFAMSDEEINSAGSLYEKMKTANEEVDD